MLNNDHGPQGDHTAAEWEQKLQTLDVIKGINATIATYHQFEKSQEARRAWESRRER
jgi:hypothetical protein